MMADAEHGLLIWLLPGKPVRCWIRTSRSVTSGAGWPRERNIYISMGKGIWSSGTKKCAGWFFVYSCVWTINQIELALESCCLAIGLVIKSYRISHRKSLFSHRISYSKKVPKEYADNWRGQKYMIYTDIQLKEKIIQMIESFESEVVEFKKAKTKN